MPPTEPERERFKITKNHLWALLFALLAIGVAVLAYEKSGDPGVSRRSLIEQAQCDVASFASASERCAATFATCTTERLQKECRSAYLHCLPPAPEAPPARDSAETCPLADPAGGRPAGPEACVVARDNCLIGAPQPTVCSAVAVTCVRDSYRFAFAARCAEADCHCARGEYAAVSCVAVHELCARGESSPAADQCTPERARLRAASTAR